MFTNYKTIGSDPNGAIRWSRLERIQRAGYRGKVSITAYYGADIYEISDAGVEYLGYYHHTNPEYVRPNFAGIFCSVTAER